MKRNHFICSSLLIFLSIIGYTTAYALDNSEWIEQWKNKTVRIGKALDSFQPNTWYFLYQGCPVDGNSDDYKLCMSGEYPSYMGCFLANTQKSSVWLKGITGINNCRASDVAGYLVRFVPVSGKSGCYYVQLGTGLYLNNGLTAGDYDYGVFNFYTIDNSKPGLFGFNFYDIYNTDAMLQIYSEGSSSGYYRYPRKSSTQGRLTDTTNKNYIWNIVEVIWNPYVQSEFPEDFATPDDSDAERGREVDVDNDGRMDIVYFKGETPYIKKQLPDGNFITLISKLVQDSIYLQQSAQATVKANGRHKVISMSASDALSFNNVVSGIRTGSSSSSTISTISQAIDLNGDGRSDLLSKDGKFAYVSSGDNAYCPVDFVGKIFPYDLDGNGVLDYLIYDGMSIYTMICNPQGGATQKKIFDNKNVKKIMCRDFDHDEDEDVLVYIEDGTNTYFVFLRNDGDGTFKKKEDYIEGKYSFVECRDYDADGLYEIKINPDKIIKVGTNFALTDVSSSLNMSAQNTAPQKMSKPIVAWDEATGMLRINWQHGYDAETSVCDLTYEVRIGTAPGRNDVLFNKRLAAGEGSVGTQLHTFFNIGEHPVGTYYVAVQAIDGGGKSGDWSDETVYTNSSVANPTILPYKTLDISTVDTITVIASMGNDATTYRWSVTNGEVVYQEGHKARVTFHAAGKQQVMLTTQIGGVDYSSEPLDIDVLPYKSSSAQVPFRLLDLNQDGYPDGLSGYFVLNDGKGSFSKYPKSFNSDLNLSSPYILDLNRDGYPDVISQYQSSQKGNVFINDQEGDFEYEKYQFKMTDDSDLSIGGNDEWIDFTNTGICDLFKYTYSKLMSTENYATFNLATVFDCFVSYNIKYDVNRDGYMDVVTVAGRYGEYSEIIVYLNQGNRSFQVMKMKKSYFGFYSNFKLADLNNDGIVDIITPDYPELGIYLGKLENNNYSWDLAKTIWVQDRNYGKTLCIRDYDNNGYLDLSWTQEGIGHMLLFDYNLEFTEQMVGAKYNYPFVVMDGDGYPQMMYSTIRNEKPKAPSAVSVRQTVDGMVINWTDAEDDHTPAVQMRYNVSVKRKGKTGAGSYVISPMNGGDSQAALVFPWYYKQSTTMTVPSSALTAGETYEVQVQAIDLWNQWSPMTEPVEITIAANSGDIKAPDFACIGRETAILFTGVLNGNPTIDFGEGSNYTRDGSTFRVIWSSEGVKDITIGTQHSQIIVKRPIDVSFTLPEDIYTGAELSVALSEEMVAQVGKGYFKVMQAPKNAKYTVEYKEREGKAVLIVNKPGYYEVETGCDDDLLGNSLVQSFNAKEMPQAKLQFVDAEDDHYVVNWNTSGLPASVDRVIIYREGNRQNQYLALDTVPVSNGNYVDYTSSAQMVASRYKIGLLSRGGQIFESTAHKPLHVMIGVSALGGYNLIWNPYEGMMVDNYRIWRGTSVDNMELLTQVAGSQQSFTDINAPSGEVFYAISFSPAGAPRGSARRAPIATGDVCSNILSTQSAVTMVLANSLSIVTLTDNLVLTDESRYLQLYYLLLPTYSSYRNVAWSIVEGSDIATVSSDGLLTATGGIGNVRVRVSSLDGSELTDEINIYVQCEEYLDPDRIESIEHSPLNNEYSIYDLNGRKLAAPQKGINIIRYSDGTTRKVLVK